MPPKTKRGGSQAAAPRRQAASARASACCTRGLRKQSQMCNLPRATQLYYSNIAGYCRGMANPGETSADLLLRYPGMRRIPSPRAELFDRPRFLPPDLCALLIALVDQDRRPSTIADANGDTYFRTSETCDLDPGEPAVEELEARLLELSGIDPAHGEPVQGQRYAIGQEFKAHTDYFEPGGVDFDKFCSVAGQRTWTFMIYLNEPEAGGATRFKVVDKLFQPETGKLVCWNNHRPDGTLKPATLHLG